MVRLTVSGELRSLDLEEVTDLLLDEGGSQAATPREVPAEPPGDAGASPPKPG